MTKSVKTETGCKNLQYLLLCPNGYITTQQAAEYAQKKNMFTLRKAANM